MLETLICLVSVVLAIVLPLGLLILGLILAIFKEKKPGKYKQVTLKDQKEIK